MYITQNYGGISSKKTFLWGILFVIVISQTIGSIPIIITGIITGSNWVEFPEFIGTIPTFMFMMIPFVVAFLAMLYVVRRIHRWRFTAFVTNRPKIDWQRFFFSFALWGAFVIVFTIVGYLLSPESYQLNFDWSSFLMQLVVSTLFIPMQAGFEELFFRGYLMKFFGILFRNRWLPLLFTSLLFGLLHMANPEVEEMGSVLLIYYIATGLVLGVMTLMDGGLELALGFHIANNLISTLLITSEWSALKTTSIFKYSSVPDMITDIWIPIFICYPLLLFIFIKKYKWKDWKKHLSAKLMNE